jgi:hypothetical protein
MYAKRPWLLQKCLCLETPSVADYSPTILVCVARCMQDHQDGRHRCLRDHLWHCVFLWYLWFAWNCCCGRIHFVWPETACAT